MTNAERQKRYRDKKRGGPPTGRWAGHTTASADAKLWGTSRTMLFMSRWLWKHAPDVAERLMPGATNPLGQKVVPTYKRLRGEYLLGIARALKRKPAGDRHRLVEGRGDGQFVFKWVKAKT